MRNDLDSRALAPTDCYGQRFMRGGEYRYNAVPAHGHLMSSERPFVIRAEPGGGEPGRHQHNLSITATRGKFRVSQPELVVGIGDLVLWNCPDAEAPACTVIGDAPFFRSDRMVNECGYTHAFGTAGEYHWADAHGSGLAGIVRVGEAHCKSEADLKRWHKTLEAGTLVMIDGARAEPAQIDVVIGQTVFFAVVRCPGISITDCRLIRPGTSPFPPE